MRKLETAEEKAARQKKNTLIISIFMLGIMVLSTLGYAFMTWEQGSNGSSSNSNAQLQDVNGRWVKTIQNQPFSFTMPEQSTSNVTKDIFLTLANYAQKPLYIDAGNNSAVVYEISSTLGLFASKTSQACNGPCEENLPEKNCSTDLLVVYNQSDQNSVYQKENCVALFQNQKILLQK